MLWRGAADTRVDDDKKEQAFVARKYGTWKWVNWIVKEKFSGSLYRGFRWGHFFTTYFALVASLKIFPFDEKIIQE